MEEPTMMLHRIVLAAAMGQLGCTGIMGPEAELQAQRTELQCLDTTDPHECSFRKDEGGCFVTGIGHIGDDLDRPGAGRAGRPSFGGNAMGMKDGHVRGQWQNTTHEGDLFHGRADWIRCWKDEGPGPDVPRAVPNNAEWGGTGKWNHGAGYGFRVHAQDRAEGGSHADFYYVEIYDSRGSVVYAIGDLINGGNFQIHPPNNGHPYETTGAPEGLELNEGDFIDTERIAPSARQ